MSQRLHEIMPEFHAHEVHVIKIDSSPRDVWNALWLVDFNGSWTIKILMRLRGIWRRRLGIEEFSRLFPIVYLKEGQEVVMHASMRSFWGAFTIGWNFHLEPVGASGTLLRTETRVHLPTQRDLVCFRLYWLVVEPFSRWIRRIMIRMVRRQASRR